MGYTPDGTYVQPAGSSGSQIVPSKLPFFNVKDYGAVGDNATDDTTAIQAAITAASAVNGTVVFPPGFYRCTGQLTVPAGTTVSFLGAGRLASVLYYAGGVLQPFLIFPGQNHGSTIEKMTVTGGANASPALQVLAVGGTGTHGYQSLINIIDCWIGYYYPPGGAAAVATYLAFWGASIQCDVFTSIGTGYWGRDAGLVLQAGTTDAYLLGGFSSVLPQATEPNQIGLFCDNVTTGAHFAGTLNAVLHSVAGAGSATTAARVTSAANLIGCYCESSHLPLDIQTCVLHLTGGKWNPAAGAARIFNAANSCGTLAPGALTGVTGITNIFAASSSSTTQAWTVRFPHASTIANLPTVPLSLDEPGAISFPGSQNTQPTTVVTVTSAYNARYGDVVLVNATGGAVNVTLPPPEAGAAPVTVKKIDASANGAVVVHNATETIDAAAISISMTTQWEALTVAANGTNWYVIHQVATTIL